MGKQGSRQGLMGMSKDTQDEWLKRKKDEGEKYWQDTQTLKNLRRLLIDYHKKQKELLGDIREGIGLVNKLLGIDESEYIK